MLTLKERIKCWFTRTFITRNCWMPKGDISFTSTWSDDEIPQWVKDTDKSKFEFTIDVEDDTNETLDR